VADATVTLDSLEDAEAWFRQNPTTRIVQVRHPDRTNRMIVTYRA
jgi:hypothetical protein